MRSVLTGILLLCALVCTSCSQKDARDYAKKLADLLGKYSEQINSKLADEQARYVSEAKGLESDFEEDEPNAFRTLELLKSGTLNPSAMVATLLTAYATVDFDSS